MYSISFFEVSGVLEIKKKSIIYPKDTRLKAVTATFLEAT